MAALSSNFFMALEVLFTPSIQKLCLILKIPYKVSKMAANQDRKANLIIDFNGVKMLWTSK